MANTKMSIPQYNDYKLACDTGDMERANKIMDMGYQEVYDPTLADAVEADIVDEQPLVAGTDDDIKDDILGGLDNKEICSKYDISPQKLGSIKREMK